MKDNIDIIDTKATNRTRNQEHVRHQQNAKD